MLFRSLSLCRLAEKGRRVVFFIRSLLVNQLSQNRYKQENTERNEDYFKNVNRIAEKYIYNQRRVADKQQQRQKAVAEFQRIAGKIAFTKKLNNPFVVLLGNFKHLRSNQLSLLFYHMR